MDARRVAAIPIFLTRGGWRRLRDTGSWCRAEKDREQAATPGINRRTRPEAVGLGKVSLPRELSIDSTRGWMMFQEMEFQCQPRAWTRGPR